MWNRLHVAVCGLKSVCLTSDRVKTFLFQIKKNSEQQKPLEDNFRHSKFSQILEEAKCNYWRKNNVFQTLALSKIVIFHFVIDELIKIQVIDELIKIQTSFIWKNSYAKIEHKTVILDHKQGGFKCADVTLK